MTFSLHRVYEPSLLDGEFADKLVEDVNRLLQELSTRAVPRDISWIREVATNGFLYVARERSSNRVIGMATLVIVHKLMGKEGHVEDVVVLEPYRDKGVGQLLMEKLIEVAIGNEVVSLHLTSREGRKKANRLYRRCGFELRKTNVYQLNLTP